MNEALARAASARIVAFDAWLHLDKKKAPPEVVEKAYAERLRTKQLHEALCALRGANP